MNERQNYPLGAYISVESLFVETLIIINIFYDNVFIWYMS
jgi:hypothetical protein